MRWELSGMGIVRMGIVRGWELSGMGIVRDGNCPGWELSEMGIVRWELFGMGTVRDGICPGFPVESVFPAEKQKMSQTKNIRTWTTICMLMESFYWGTSWLLPSPRTQIILSIRNRLWRRVVIPSTLHEEITQVAHQGVSSMNERAKAAVYWQGITNDIQMARDNSNSYNVVAPPFEVIALWRSGCGLSNNELKLVPMMLERQT